MKRFAGIAGVLMLAASTGFAAIPCSEMAIGGVVPGMTRKQVVAIYGKPTKEITHVIQLSRKTINYYEMQYGTSYFCWHRFMNTGNGTSVDRVDMLKTTANNGLGTPAGLMVGQPVSQMLELYGKPDSMMSKRYGRYGAKANRQTMKEFAQGKNTAVYRGDGILCGYSLYVTAKNNKIASLAIKFGGE